MGKLMIRLKWLAAVAIFFLSVSPTIHALSFTFTKIADTSTTIPDGTGNFTGFVGDFNGSYTISMDNGNVVFRGFGNNQQGIYISSGGVLETVVDSNTLTPAGTSTFGDFNPTPSIDDGNVAFSALGSQGGIYINVGGVISTVANSSTPIPGKTDDFRTLNSSPSISGSNVAIVGNDHSYPHPDSGGVYAHIGGTLSTIADANTAIPDGTGNFTQLDLWHPSIDGNSVLFSGRGSNGQEGIYINNGGILETTVNNSNTPIPDGTDIFTDFGHSDIDGNNVVFRGFGSDQEGIYVAGDSGLRKVADLNTAIPEGIGNFTALHPVAYYPAVDNGNIAFLGLGSSSQRGIYIEFGGVLEKVIDLNDMLDGKELSSLEFSDGLSGNSIAFYASFTDNTKGIFVAELIITTYNCIGFEPPMANGPVTVRKNRALPLKAQIFDEEGYLITGTDVVSPPVIQILFDSGVSEDPIDVTDEAYPVGQGSDGNQFVFTEEDKWQFNLKTKNYNASGTYHISTISGDSSEYNIDPECTATFIIE